MEYIKVCPLAADLSTIKNCNPCPEEGCDKVFQATSALHLHITKHHRHANLQRKDKSVPTRYYCPVESCVYHVNASRFFTQMKNLKQHYLKCHGERKFACTGCTKAFPTEDVLNHHKQICGITFSCSCGNNYGSYEALLTHSKRKRHAFDEIFKQYGKRIKSNKIVPMRKDEVSPLVGTPVYILPKLSPEYVGVPVHYLAAVALTELSKSCTKIGIDKVVQTEPIETRRKKASSPARASERGSKRRASAQTQTGVITRARRPRKSAKTQTIGAGTLHCTSKPPKNLVEVSSCNEEPNSFKLKKSMETQTSLCNFDNEYLGEECNFEDPAVPTSKLTTGSSSSSSSPLYPMAKDVGLPDLWFAHKNTSSTQTSPVSGSQTTISSDLNLTFFECDGNVSSTGLRNLNYFEENSDSLDNVVNSTVSQFEQTSNNCTENLNGLESLTTVSKYQLLSQPESRSCNIETQTELDSSSAFLSQCSDGSGEGQFTLCSNIETQTTEDIFDELLYSNMCTQTCDEGLFSDLDFVDIETQTAWPNYGDSQETKLILNGSKTSAVSTLSISPCVNPPLSNNSKTLGQPRHKSAPAPTVKVVIQRHTVQTLSQSNCPQTQK